MRLANPEDKDQVIDLITRAYQSNPSILWIVKQDEHFFYRVGILAEYLFEFGIANQGIWLTENEKGLCLIYDLKNKKSGWRVWKKQVKLAIKGITLPRVREILHREKKVNEIRGNTEGLYALLYAIDPEHRSVATAIEVQRFVYEKADRENKTIYAETTIPKNKRVYEKYGFDTYAEWESKNKKLITWFLKREPGRKRK